MARGEPAKTIGHARAGGETKLTIHCLGCCHRAVKTFEELKLWNDMIFVDVSQHRRLVCSQCDGRNIKVMPILPPARGTPGHQRSRRNAGLDSPTQDGRYTFDADP
jgi:hypothetical protein